MTAAAQIALALGSVVVLLGLMMVIRRVAVVWNIGAELQRKLVHIGTGIYAIVLPWLFPDRWPVYVLVVVTLLVMLVLRLPNSRLGRTLHGVDRQSYGDLLLAVSVGLCLFLSEGRLFLYVLPIAVLTLADATAALVGRSYGTRFFRVEEGDKSIEGSTVFFAVTLLISVICLMLMTPFPPLNIIVLSVMVAAFGTLVEAVSWRGFDNLFLPMGLLIFLSVHAEDPLLDLLALAVLFAGCIVAFKFISPKIGLTNHAARVYVTAVFLLLAVTELQNALFPILVLAAHVWSRSVAPSNSKFPDLDIVAGLAMVSFGSLTLGNATGWNAVSFYGIVAMGMMIGHCALALGSWSSSARYIGIAGIFAAALGMRAIVVGLNPDGANWNGPMWFVVVASAVLMAIVPSAFPALFTRARVTKLTLLALSIPLASYLYAIDIPGLWA
ncbi:diacylglycerol/polyprenol kinase family protein [Pseudorhodobacter sp.]|uniref:diacylglycerol/polyprenol kinase family protein n=1 Tax=Pseudorhodobacter sp. TaxID=1934400 RepID=UPI0026495A36|nr:hypothetical protein [Pseudorhodobacter sp.]MDN5786899.1 hypothetical protein [Pseudorhodobacter sp.]